MYDFFSSSVIVFNITKLSNVKNKNYPPFPLLFLSTYSLIKFQLDSKLKDFSKFII